MAVDAATWARLRGAAEFWAEGCRLQADRLDPKNTTQDSLKNARHDLNFYVVAATCLQNVARRVAKRGLPDVQAALDAFTDRWPRFRELRNLEEYSDGTIEGASLVAYFHRQVSDLRPDGSVIDLVDVEEMQPQIERVSRTVMKSLDKNPPFGPLVP